ncbi:C4-dicarboxylate ABC transporter [Ignatzschineria sp. F8392]|uniref:C4-dicarboxylate transporter DcuC n=1 Tax=Ignatzschineria sp. F8392 TaxID=1980117 RepID=UPI000B98C1BB|nr:C4-dicarboxylate transporter DcuC [Ignatzschineria sp. F8392]OYQ79484.1 C4-dicarboxylate ABC transporter [Ignatzschineria sp. F8392]
MLEIIISILFLIAVGYFVTKNYDAKIVLFLAAFLLLFISVFLGHTIETSTPTGSIWLDPFAKATDVFKMQMGIVGLTIMMLFGFAAYMNHIGANDAMVAVLSKPIQKIRSVYILVPVVFLLGNALQMVLPSAAGLAILLMATLYPALRTAGMSPLTAGAVIATTATITPTPLGSDNVVVAQHLGISSLDYVLKYHAKVSIPALLIMAVAHLFWQRHLDRRAGTVHVPYQPEHSEAEKLAQLKPAPLWYAIFPIVPILLLLLFNLAFINPETGKPLLKMGLPEITLISILIPLLIELIRKRSFQKSIKDFNLFFEGMGQGFFQVVSLIIAAGLFVESLKAIGIITTLTNSLNDVEGAGPILMFFFSGMAALIGFLSGSGIAVFHSFIKIIPEITTQMDVNTVLVALPMQLTANLIRSASPVAAVIIIVASVLKVNPLVIVKRTSVPVFVGIFTCLALSYYFYG